MCGRGEYLSINHMYRSVTAGIPVSVSLACLCSTPHTVCSNDTLVMTNLAFYRRTDPVVSPLATADSFARFAEHFPVFTSLHLVYTAPASQLLPPSASVQRRVVESTPYEDLTLLSASHNSGVKG